MSDDGKPFRYRPASQMRAIQRFARGENLTPIAQQMQGLGERTPRAFCQFGGPGWSDKPGGALSPDEATPAVIRAYCQWWAARGMYVDLCILTCTDFFGQGRTQRADRVAAIIDATKDLLNVRVEVVNEPGNGSPGSVPAEVVTDLGLWDPTRRPYVMSSGAYGIVDHEGEFKSYTLDAVLDQGDRDPDWPGEAGKMGHFVYDGWNGNGVDDPGWGGFHGMDVAVSEQESMGAAEVDQPGHRDANPNNHGDAAAGYAMGSVETAFHSTSGVEAALLGPNELKCAQAVQAAHEFFPADSALGRYSHDSFADFPLVSIGNRPDLTSEVAGRVFADRAYVVAAQATKEWYDRYRQPKPGWAIVREGGPVGNWLELQRV